MTPPKLARIRKNSVSPESITAITEFPDSPVMGYAGLTAVYILFILFTIYLNSMGIFVVVPDCDKIEQLLLHGQQKCLVCDPAAHLLRY